MRHVFTLCLLIVFGTRPLGAQRIDLRDTVALAARVESALKWESARTGLAWSQIELAAGTLGVPVRAIVVRLEPARFRFQLVTRVTSNRVTGAWTIDSIPPEAVLAFNAGQFKEAGPWGWLVIDGVTRGLPGYGPLSAGVAFDSAGAVHWFAPPALERARRRPFLQAFQSFPLLLLNGQAPRLLHNRKLVDQKHRDARLVFAQHADGSLLLLLTRFDMLGARAERVPIGLTTPETLQLMRALGVRHALMLDGGISAQMLLRTADGETHRWPGVRAVPVGMVAVPR